MKLTEDLSKPVEEGRKPGLKVRKLRCEYRVNPLGIDVLKPRLSWIVESSERGQFQTAYQIIVSSTRLNLEKDIGDLWDTGKVQSKETSQITYAGKTLSSRMECWWKVRVWDKRGRPSEWSEPAYWTMGLLEPNDWKARWIGYDEYAEWEEPNFKGCKWIWFKEGDPAKEAPVADRYFRRTISLPSDRKMLRGIFLITADDQFVLFVNGKEAGRSNGKPYAWQRPQMIKITDLLHAGLNVFAIKATNTGGSAGLLGKVIIEFEDGKPFILVTDASWKSSETSEEGWEKPDFDDSGWMSAFELGDFKTKPWGILATRPPYVRPPPFFRKRFTIEKKVKRALIYVSALGSCELRLNGKRVTEDYFIPGWPDYRKRAYYRTYDVTSLLNHGENAIGVILHSEWYSGYQGGWGRLNRFGRGPRLLLQLEIEYYDGESQIVVSDESWKVTYGPILEADNYMGETYDARREIRGWDEPWFKDDNWGNVTVDNVGLQLTAHPGEPVRKTMELQAKSVREISPGVFVFDFGQNMVGVIRLRVRNAEPGTRIMLRYAEVLNPDGTLHTANLRGARATDIYICKGGSEEFFEPRFTYHGFRYVEVTGYPGKPPIDAVTGIVIHTDIQIVGDFRCSNPLLNRLVQNILWSLRGNYFEVPTDCPQRDERQGWTGDAQIFARTAAYLADISAFMTKWLIDLNDSQREDGAYPDVAPATGAGFGTPCWGDAGIIIPYVVWRTYGDTRVIRLYYEKMARYINYLVENSKGFLRPEIGYGDWVPAGPETPKDVIATAYFAYVVKLMVEMAREIGKTDDAKRFEELFNNIRTAFHKAYVQPDGQIKGETQTCYALALDLKLLPREMEETALKHLVKDIEERGWHLSTGFVGTRHLMQALTKFGKTDLAYRLLLQETYPSWLYTVKLGATTIWERWNSMTEEGIHEPGMNSFNHYAFGSVGEWLFSTVAGIDVEDTGFKSIIIKPKPSRELGRVHASYESIRGTVSVDWWFSGDAFHLQLVIPANTSALVYVPTSEPERVMESGKPAEKSECVKLIGIREGCVVYRVLSGSYSFTVA
ncbi:MAG: family 78 glycoside hydrolase catalytic domain [Candidatus Brockarchaeota archaeon]|nr:family 78 glycoside hydrolase catalytic domain [Candidatus Brockarchaeota archaeon]